MPAPAVLEFDSDEPFERGRQRGSRVAAEMRRTWPVYCELFAVTARDAGHPPVDPRAVADACLDAVASWSPALLVELEGVAAGSGFDLRDVMALNARTEVLARARGAVATECSAVVEMRGPAGTAIGSQTWDWHADLADGWHLQSVCGDEHRFVGLTEYGMLAKIGVNSAGLAVHFNLLRHVSDVDDEAGGLGSPLAGVPVHLLARAVLGGAATVAEAADLIRTAPIAASSVLTLVTPDEAAAVEVCPGGVAVVEPTDGWLVHTNHFLDPQLAAGERVTTDVTTTFERRQVLRARVKETDQALDGERLAELLGAHEADGAAVCRHRDDEAPFGWRTATLATVALDPLRRSASISPGGPCRRQGSVTTVTAG